MSDSNKPAGASIQRRSRRPDARASSPSGQGVGFQIEDGDAVLVIDLLNDFTHDDGEALLGSFRGRAPNVRRVLEAARETGVPVIYINDERGTWTSDAAGLVRRALDGKAGDLLPPLLPRAGDAVLLKHRYSAFDHTALSLLLEELGARRVIVVGAATEGCVVQTAIDARERGLKASIVADACATTDAELEAIALAYAEEVGGVHLERVTPLDATVPCHESAGSS